MPVRNEGSFIARSLSAALAQDYPADKMEVIIADGMSTDGTRETVSDVARTHANLRLIDNPRQIVSTGLNAAIREAKGEILIRVDGHCEISPDYVRLCVAQLLKDHAECVGGPLETIGETYVAQVIAAAMSSRFGVGDSSFRIGASEPKLVDTVPFPAYKRETLRRVGNFDEELVRNQDDEYNYRLRKLGGRILLSPEIRSRYYSRAAFGSLWKQYFQYGFWKVRVLQKHARQMRLRQFGPALFVASLLVTLLLWPWIHGARFLPLVIAGTYTVVSLAASVFTARRHGWKLLPLLPLAFAILHVGYGCGFIAGLMRFWNRWGSVNPKLQPPRLIENSRL